MRTRSSSVSRIVNIGAVMVRVACMRPIITVDGQQRKR